MRTKKKPRKSTPAPEPVIGTPEETAQAERIMQEAIKAPAEEEIPVPLPPPEYRAPIAPTVEQAPAVEPAPILEPMPEPLPAIEIVDLPEPPAAEYVRAEPVRVEQTVVRWGVTTAAVAPADVVDPGVSPAVLSAFGNLNQELGRLRQLVEQRNSVATPAEWEALRQKTMQELDDPQTKMLRAHKREVLPELPALPEAPLLPSRMGTLTIEEAKQNIQALGERIKGFENRLNVVVRIYRENDTAHQRAGYTEETKSWCDYVQFMIEETRVLERNRVAMNALRGIGVVNNELSELRSDVEKLYFAIDQHAMLNAIEDGQRKARAPIVRTLPATPEQVPGAGVVLGVDLAGEAPASGGAGEVTPDDEDEERPAKKREHGKDVTDEELDEEEQDG